MRGTDRVVGGTTTEPKGLEVDSRRDREGATTQTSLGASSPSARFLSRRLGGPHAAPQRRSTRRARARFDSREGERENIRRGGEATTARRDEVDDGAQPKNIKTPASQPPRVARGRQIC